MFQGGMLPGTIVVKYYLRGFEEGWQASTGKMVDILES